MAKPIAKVRQPHRLTGYQPDAPGIVVTPQPFWSPAKGMDTISRLNRLDPQYAVLIQNMRLRDGTMQSRQSLTQLGGTGDNIMAVVPFVTSDGHIWVVRFRTDGVDYYDNGSWVAVTVPGGLTGTTTDYFTYTAFNDRLIFSNGVNGLYEWDVSFQNILKIDGGPPCKHITTFNSRLLASQVLVGGEILPTRIQWCAKNNSRAWAVEDIGTGFEDLLSTPGGVVDQQRGVHPVSDYTAIVLRSASTWQITETGDPDAPFRFSRIYSDLGCLAPYSAVDVPGGVVALMSDGVYLISDGQVQPLSARVWRDILNSVSDYIPCVGAYDPTEREYSLLMPPNTIWRYSFRDQGWTRDEYAQELNYISFLKVSGTLTLTIDSSTGVIDDAVGTIDSEVGTLQPTAAYYSQPGTGVKVFKDSTASTDDGTPAPIYIVTGLMQAASPLEQTLVTEVEFEYESNTLLTFFIEYRDGTNDSWHMYDSPGLVQTYGPKTGKGVKTIVGHNLQFRLRTQEVGDWRLLSFVPKVVLGQNDSHSSTTGGILT